MSDSPTSPSAPEPAEQPWQTRLRRHPWRALLGMLALAIVVLLLLWDWNWFKGPIERQVEARTGRRFEIAGNLDVDLGRVPVIRADGLSFANADWAKQPLMASAQRLEIAVEFWPLLKGEVRVPDIRLIQPRLNLQSDPKHGGNWKFGRDSGGELPVFRRIWIDDGRLRFLDAAGKTDIDLAVASRAAQRQDAAPPVEVEGGGRWKNNRFTLEGRAESPLALRDAQRPYRLNLRAAAGATRAHARGELVDPFHLRDFDLQLALAGKNLADLYPLIGIAIPPTPPYALDGRLSRDGVRWHYDRFTGKVGDSDLAGSASVDTGGPRPYLRADLVSKRLDLDDLAGFVGAPPQTGRGESINPELAAEHARLDASPKLLPATPYRLDKLRAMDAEVKLKAARIEAPGWPLDDMQAHLLLENGLLKLDPLNFGVADGDIRSIITMDARRTPIRTRADITARKLTLAKLVPKVKLAQDAVGKVGGRIALTGNGNSIATMLASSDGNVAVGMGPGQISNLLMEFAGLDLAEILKFKLTQDRKIPIRCAFGDFTVDDGIMTARALAFDTSDTILVGSGTIDLGEEKLDLLIRPRPKDRSLLALRTPLTVTGSFKHPSARPDFKRLGLRGAAAVALGSIAPPAALLATIELGPGKDAGCAGHVVN
ncbi:AsmA family protein [Lysobacter antibioticus]|uniref:AsmA family protein n=1 Tax=Lysobacter antibioticus TaxID=84531 RepID=A0A0S2F7Z0_LYSAN|nr:AsmA family protein [Lysobacter antibioticus]ALN79650.1 asmA family protein [Lysobacter antibioticus]